MLHPALIAALAAAKVVYIPNPSDLTKGYKIGSRIDVPPNVRIVGANKHSTKLINHLNGNQPVFKLSENVQLENIFIDGNGANFSGSGINFFDGAGKQSILNCKIINFNGPCILFGPDDASQSFFSNLELNRNQNSANQPAYAVEFSINPPSGNNSARPRKFDNIETGGNPSFSFGACNNVYIVNSFLGKLSYTSNSRAVLIANSRIANAESIIIDGHNNSIVGCDIYPIIYINQGAVNNAIQGNSYNQDNMPDGPIIDNSGHGRNSFSLNSSIVYPVLLTSTGNIQPDIANGNIRGEWTRSGSIVTVTIELTMGDNTTLGNGDLKFSIPSQIVPHKTPFHTHVQAQYGTGVCYSPFGTSIIASVLVTGTNYITGLTSGTNYNLKNGVPFPTQGGNVIRLSITYSL